jgi:hypothetical protein
MPCGDEPGEDVAVADVGASPIVRVRPQTATAETVRFMVLLEEPCTG